MMSGTRVSYHDEQQPLEGCLAAHASGRNLPGVLVMPSWLNINESICRRADRLAELGYAVPARTRISVQGRASYLLGQRGHGAAIGWIIPVPAAALHAP
jgi:dienelactone hydrolase